MVNYLSTIEFQLLTQFIEHPTKQFGLRELGRILRKSHVTIKKHLKNLEKNKLIIPIDETLYQTYLANNEQRMFRKYKQRFIVDKIEESGLIDFLEKSFFPSCIIIFGSCASGTFHEKSDIDIFVQATEKSVNLSRFEAKLKRSITLLFEPRISNLPEELMHNISNGIIVQGFLDLTADEQSKRI
jgi:predicted nucleotidyltransferase